MPPREDCGITHTGNVRSNNEDVFLCDARHGLWVVADGMCGHESGEVASVIVIETIRTTMEKGKTLQEAIQLSHHAIIDGAARGQGALDNGGRDNTILVLIGSMTKSQGVFERLRAWGHA